MLNRARGRPRLPGTPRFIRLRSSVFDLFRQRKVTYDFTNKPDSVFVEFLLHRVEGNEDSTIRNEEQAQSTIREFDARMTSTPVKHSTQFLDVTGVTTSDVPSVKTSDVPSVYNSYYMYVPKGEECDSDSDSDRSDYIDEDDVEFEKSMSIALAELNASDTEDTDSSESDFDTASDSDMDISDNDPEATVTMVDPYYASISAVQETPHEINGDSSDNPCNNDVHDISDNDPEATVTMVDPYYASTSSVQETSHEKNDDSSDKPCNNDVNVDHDVQEPSSTTVEKNADVIVKDAVNAFCKLTECSTSNLEQLLCFQKLERIIVTVAKLIELKGNVCTNLKDDEKVCGLALTHTVRQFSTRIEISWCCTGGHCWKWDSSEVLTKKRNSVVYAIDSLVAASIILSGNNYSKIELLCKCLNLDILSLSSFNRFQKHCAVPVINDFWKKMNGIIVGILKKYNEIILCGDGRNDSPGHCARYCVYTIMEHFTHLIVDIEVLDKRETGGNSVTMEKEGLRRLLRRISDMLQIDEITTDASSSIIKLVAEMKEKFPKLLELFHSLDVWHKCKKLNKSLHKAAKVKGCQSLKDWIPAISNHFWHCCQTAEGSVEELKSVWIGVLHHVCGEHSWVTGSCKHGPLTDEDEPKNYLLKSSKAMEGLRKIVLDNKWMKNLSFYVKFRHTSELESFNSMLTKYAPKRMAFEYPYFIMRIIIAVIDHNMHLLRSYKTTNEGKQRGHRKYSKRSQKFHAELVKEKKGYHYLPYLVARMMGERKEFEGSFTQKSDDNVFNPKKIAPTLGMKQAPPTEELMKGPSRIQKVKKPEVTETTEFP